MNQRKTALLAMALAGAFALSAGAAESQSRLRAQARVTEAQATATALSNVPKASVKSVELEREHGRLVWSFDLAQPGTTDVTEVQVDAASGRIVSRKKESAAQEASEAKAQAADPAPAE
jgi:uncharacterized membrane protein YkoI